jgi:hypothetical protein
MENYIISFKMFSKLHSVTKTEMKENVVPHLRKPECPQTEYRGTNLKQI